MPMSAYTRDIDHGDPIPPLGERVKPQGQSTQGPQPLPHNREVLRRPDGKFETAIERNKGAA